MALQPIAGTDVGVITVSSTYADNSAHVSALQSILADEAWQEFSARAAASAGRLRSRVRCSATSILPTNRAATGHLASSRPRSGERYQAA